MTVDRPMNIVVGYLRDFAHTEQWDPGTVSCVRTDAGPLRVGSTWRNVSTFMGRRAELDYRLARLVSAHLTFVGRNDKAVSVDDITFVPDGARTRITYQANIQFSGVARFAAPFLRREFNRLADEVAEQLPATINAL
jgi:carbon monoxide dehydrogenase subunit G